MLVMRMFYLIPFGATGRVVRSQPVASSIQSFQNLVTVCQDLVWVTSKLAHEGRTGLCLPSPLEQQFVVGFEHPKRVSDPKSLIHVASLNMRPHAVGFGHLSVHAGIASSDWRLSTYSGTTRPILSSIHSATMRRWQKLVSVNGGTS